MQLLCLGFISNIPVGAISPPTHLSTMPAPVSPSLLYPVSTRVAPFFRHSLCPSPVPGPRTALVSPWEYLANPGEAGHWEQWWECRGGDVPFSTCNGVSLPNPWPEPGPVCRACSGTGGATGTPAPRFVCFPCPGTHSSFPGRGRQLGHDGCLALDWPSLPNPIWTPCPGMLQLSWSPRILPAPWAAPCGCQALTRSPTHTQNHHPLPSTDLFYLFGSLMPPICSNAR